MKKYGGYFFLLFMLISACSTDNDTEWKNQEEAKNDQYFLENIHFYLADGDGIIDTVRYQLDTMNYINSSNIPQPSQTFYPYQAMLDSFKVEVNEQFPLYDRPVAFADSIIAPSMVRNDKIYFSQDMPVIIKEIPGFITRKCNSAGTSVSTSVPPQVIITVTGTYYRIRAKASFMATYRGKNTGNEISVKGRWYNSTVTSESLNGSSGINTTVTDIK